MSSSPNLLNPLRTVGLVMHDPSHPPYRRVENQMKQQRPHPLRSRSAATNTTGWSTATWNTMSATKTASGAVKGGFTPTPTMNAMPKDVEAAETLMEVRDFEETLKKRTLRSFACANDYEKEHASVMDGDTSQIYDKSASAETLRSSPSPLPQRVVVKILPRLFSELLLRHNSVVSRLRKMGRDAVLKNFGETGRRLGMRAVTSQELFFLLSCMFDEKTLWKDDTEYLFRFFDYGSKGTMDFKDFLYGVSVLFVPLEVQAAVHCRRILCERLLDDSIISIADVNMMLSALSAIFASRVPEVPALCNEVYQSVENVMPMYTVPLADFRAEVQRLPTLNRCISAVQLDGSINWSEVLLGPCEEDVNTTYLERQMKLVNEAIADGREVPSVSIPVQDRNYNIDFCHARFVSDRYLLRTSTPLKLAK